MKRALWFLAAATLSLSISPSVAQQPFFRCDTVRWGEFSFPVFKRTSSSAAIKVNEHLQLAELQMLQGHEKDHLFEAVIPDGRTESLWGKTGMSFEILANSAVVLCLRLDQQATDMTSRYWSTFYVFNAQTGDALTLPAFFTEKGYKAFYQHSLSSRLAHYYRDSTDVRQEIMAYNSENIAESIADSDLADFFIQDDSIVIEDASSLSKFSSYSLQTAFGWQELGPWLSPLGAAIAAGDTACVARLRTATGRQVYEGTVGGKAAVALLDGNSIAHYGRAGGWSYVSSGSAYELFHDEPSGDSVVLNTLDSDGAATGTMTVIIDAQGVKGTWKKQNRLQPVSFRQR